MRYLLTLWFVPLALFWGWYGLSANDLNLGTVYLSRELHDYVFAIYGHTLGVDPVRIPGMLASASIVDSALIGGIVAYRKRTAWWPGFRLRAEFAWFRMLAFSGWNAKSGMSGPLRADCDVPVPGEAKPIRLDPLTTVAYDPAHPAE